MNVCFEGCLLWLYYFNFKCMTDRCSFQPSNGENWSLPQFIFWVRAGTRGTGPGDNGSDWSRPITWPGYWPRIGRVHWSVVEEVIIAYLGDISPGSGWSSSWWEPRIVFIEMMRLLFLLVDFVSRSLCLSCQCHLDDSSHHPSYPWWTIATVLL